MQSKRDQVQAHLFLMSRLSSGMLRANPDNPESPGGRTHRGLFMGLLCALLVCVVAALWGVISPGQDSTWKKEGTMVMEKETGTRYLYLDGRLRPVLNYTSARLLAGADMKTATVKRRSTDGVAHGAPVGIAGAPDDLPGRDRLAPEPWRVCSVVHRHVSGRTTAFTRLAIAAQDTGRPLTGSQALLLAAPNGTRYLVWKGSRLKLGKGIAVAESLGYGSVTARPVSNAVINALPAGPDLNFPEVEGRGRRGPDLAGASTRIGQVVAVQVPGSAPQYQLLLDSGLVPLTSTQQALVMGDPRTRAKAYVGKDLVARAVPAEAVRDHLAPGSKRLPTAGLPDSPPQAVEVPEGTEACVVVAPSDGRGMTVSTGLLSVGVSADNVAEVPSVHVSAACTPVDLIETRPGRGVLIRELSSAGTQMGDTTYLVTDSGVKYPVTSAEALGSLGFGAADARGLPTAVLAMLPTGPALDVTATAGGSRAAAPGTRCPAGAGSN
ncbi:type VII secretion protein EccB [Streptomyces sp. NPDC056707]|uniref:type VII secretion protein EccB n=1 Tax=Streptomyces sp. NPDC056707 TaxID=3345919 RepID=UPI00368904AC